MYRGALVLTGIGRHEGRRHTTRTLDVLDWGNASSNVALDESSNRATEKRSKRITSVDSCFNYKFTRYIFRVRMKRVQWDGRALREAGMAVQPSDKSTRRLSTVATCKLSYYNFLSIADFYKSIETSGVFFASLFLLFFTIKWRQMFFSTLYIHACGDFCAGRGVDIIVAAFRWCSTKIKNGYNCG